MVRLTRFLSAPIFIWWDITYACNLHCKQCYSNSGRPAIDELSTEEVRAILRQLSEMEVFYVYYLGGEPFIRPDFIEIAAYTISLGLPIVVSTNGWLIDDKKAHEIKQSGIQHVRVSIDGAIAETHDSIRGRRGSFERALSAIQSLKQAGIPKVGMVPTIMQDNFHEVEAMVDLAIENNVDEMQLVQLCGTGRGKTANSLTLSQLQRLRQIAARKQDEVRACLHLYATEGILKSRCQDCYLNRQSTPLMMGCTAGRTSVALSPEGKVMPCLLDRQPAGDLREQTLNQIWRDSPQLTDRRTIKDKCLECGYSEICARECPLEQNFPKEDRNLFADHCAEMPSHACTFRLCSSQKERR